MRFSRDCLDGLDERAAQRGENAGHIAEVIRSHLPLRFEHAAEVLAASFGPELPSTDSFGMAPIRYLPHSICIRRDGLGSFDTAIRPQYELTKRFTAEFSLSPFLVRHPQQTLDQLQQWATDSNLHVRQAVSLPWASHLEAFRRDPAGQWWCGVNGDRAVLGQRWPDAWPSSWTEDGRVAQAARLCHPR